MVWYILLGVLMAVLLGISVWRAARDNVRSRRGQWSLTKEIARPAHTPKHSR